MKKRYLLFSLIIIFSFCMNVHAADKYYVWFEKDGFPSNDDFLQFETTLCSTQVGKNCVYRCVGSSDIVTDGSSCNDTGIDSVAFNQSSSNLGSIQATMKSKLGSIMCNMRGKKKNVKCLEYLKNNYCTVKTSDSFCSYLNESNGSVIENEDGETVCPPVTLKDVSFVDKNCTINDITFTISYIKSKKDVYFRDNGLNSNIIYSDHNVRLCKTIVYLHGKGESQKKFEENFISKIDGGTCPQIRWCSDVKQHGDGYYHYYAELSGTCDSSKYEMSVFEDTDGDGISSGIEFSEFENRDRPKKLIGDAFDIKTCKDLFEGTGENGSMLLDVLKVLVSVVKVGVPALLLIMGSIDFVKAIFSQDEGAIRKAQAKFIKRLIVAVIIFLIPTILKALLGIAHNIWPKVVSDADEIFCGIL